jgi:hypothetical protein
MMKQFVRVGEAFPNRLFVAISVLLCLPADGAFTAQPRKPSSATDCASPSNKNRPPCAVESPTGFVTVFRPKLSSNAVGRLFKSQVEVWIDNTLVGTVKGDAPLILSLPNGPHTFTLKRHDDAFETMGRTREAQITVSAKKPLYFQIIDQGQGISAGELDACTGQALLAGDDTKMASSSGTIYLYWPRPSVGLGFLDKFATDLPVFLDGKRIGAVKLGEYLALTVPAGQHVLGLDVGSGVGPRLKNDFILGAGSTRNFRVEHADTVRMFEESSEEAADSGKGLKQREVIQVALPATESKVECSGAFLQATVSGKEQKDQSAAAPPQAAASGLEGKDKPKAYYPSLPVLAANERNMASVPGTIYLYWPKPGLGFDFLERYAADTPVFLDGKRIGAVKLGEYLVLTAPAGEHALGLDAGLGGGRLLKKSFDLEAGSTHHFHVENHDTVRIIEDSPEEAADHAKGLRQREVIVQ